MFTGIVEERGEVVALEARGDDDARLHVRGPLVVSDAREGDSIAVDGVCLTVTGRPVDGVFAVDVMGETLRRSSLGARSPGDPVNLERALRADSRLGGHVVQGHVDGVGHVLARTPSERWEMVRFSVPSALARYVAEKGSITVDGVSLTVTGVGDDGPEVGPGGLDLTGERSWLEVGLIPTTLAATTLGARQPGDAVNLEVDVLAKHVERLLQARGGSAGDAR
ncbi:riboflavin synthase [uncultured Pseudokineococcus sp.]|uniref:riboflavin synthase n=1 Tax=uncultured Pseudokineococcus sp. TaxID=1642928 RepID=UPI0026126114|nr:riboflavin synthase [uncultured Pseudokineococcus sp.]